MTRRCFLAAPIAAGIAARIEAAAAQAPPKIRVTKVDPVVMKGTRNLAAWILVRVKTDQGVEGIGECCSWDSSNLSRALEIRDMVDSVGARLSGSNPLLIQSHLDHWAREANSPEWAAAMSGIEIALWDILGKVAGLPVYQLLGGAVRDRVPLYANHAVFAGATDPKERLRRALETKEAGFRMFKWDPFHGGGTPDPSSLSRALDEIRRFREGFGANFPLAIDGHGRFTLEGALSVCKRLEEFHPTFFEEPVPQNQLDAYKQISAATSIPLASGKSLASFREAKRVVDAGAIRVLQPEAGACGGILEFTRLASYAGLCGLKVAPRGWCGPVLNRATTHLCAALPNLLMQEYPVTAREDKWENDLLVPPSVIRNGEMVLPEGPGLGFELNEKLLASRQLGR
jgi:galactonate dehydratase